MARVNFNSPVELTMKDLIKKTCSMVGVVISGPMVTFTLEISIRRKEQEEVP
jgi:hypothetical protein